MIIIRYLVKETLKSQLSILFVLLLIFFCQKLVRILSAAVDGEIPTNLVFSLLMLGLAEMGQLILPLSLFLAILITFGRLYSESEMVAMFACGINKGVLLKAVAFLAIVTSGFAVVNNFILAPKSMVFQEYLLANAKVNPSLAGVVEGAFQPSQDKRSVLYIGNVQNNKIQDVFVAQLNSAKNQRPSIIVADKGRIEKNAKGDQIIHLDEATSYEGTTQLLDFRITDFKDYQAVIEYQDVTTKDIDVDIEQYSFSQLMAAQDDIKAKTELHWRFTLIFSVFVMALLVLPLSEVNPRQGRVASLLPAIILYLIFFLLQSSIRSNGYKGKLDPLFWMWAVNLVYLGLAVAINLWDTMPVRHLRDKLRGK